VEPSEEFEVLSEEETEKLFCRTVSSLSFIYGQKPNDMIFVLNEVGNFNDLIILCLVSKDIELPIRDVYNLWKKEKDFFESHKNNVIQLWKKKEDTSAQNVDIG